jgi:hypothetical protein
MATDSNLQILLDETGNHSLLFACVTGTKVQILTLLDETGNQLATRLRDTGLAKKKLKQRKKTKENSKKLKRQVTSWLRVCAIQV